MMIDLEYYVPKNQRSSKTSTLRANPGLDGQFLLGGVFTDINLTTKPEHVKYTHLWIWENQEFTPESDPLIHEKELLVKIYEYFQKGWKRIFSEQKRMDLFTVGTGIARFDLPILYIRSIFHEIASPKDLFSVYQASKPIDLTNVGMSFVRPKTIWRPVATGDLMRRFKISQKKDSGQIVWDLFDLMNYKAIEERTQEEVRINIELYRRMNELTNNIHSKRNPYKNQEKIRT